MSASGLARYMMREGLINDVHNQIISGDHSNTGCVFAKYIVSLGIFDESQLVEYLTRKTRFKRVDKQQMLRPQLQVQGVIDLPLLQSLEVVPLELNGKTLKVAMADPLDSSTLEQLAFFTGYRIEPVIAKFSELYSVLRDLIQDFEPKKTKFEELLKMKGVEKTEIKTEEERSESFDSSQPGYEEEVSAGLGYDEEEALDFDDGEEVVDDSPLEADDGGEAFADVDLESMELDSGLLEEAEEAGENEGQLGLDLLEDDEGAPEIAMQESQEEFAPESMALDGEIDMGESRSESGVGEDGEDEVSVDAEASMEDEEFAATDVSMEGEEFTATDASMEDQEFTAIDASMEDEEFTNPDQTTFDSDEQETEAVVPDSEGESSLGKHESTHIDGGAFKGETIISCLNRTIIATSLAMNSQSAMEKAKSGLIEAGFFQGFIARRQEGELAQDLSWSEAMSAELLEARDKEELNSLIDRCEAGECKPLQFMEVDLSYFKLDQNQKPPLTYAVVLVDHSDSEKSIVALNLKAKELAISEGIRQLALKLIMLLQRKYRQIGLE